MSVRGIEVVGLLGFACIFSALTFNPQPPTPNPQPPTPNPQPLILTQAGPIGQHPLL